MVDVIGDSLGQVTGVDFDESATRVNYVNIHLNWNIDQPLRFKRNFTFGHDENVLLSFHYERLCNFCVLCGMISHDKNHCPLRFDLGNNNPELPDDHDDDEGKDKRGEDPSLMVHEAMKATDKVENV